MKESHKLTLLLGGSAALTGLFGTWQNLTLVGMIGLMSLMGLAFITGMILTDFLYKNRKR